MLRKFLVLRCYVLVDFNVRHIQLHGFCDASEVTYTVGVYLGAVSLVGILHKSPVVAKIKVAPIKRLSIPRLELCGAVLLKGSCIMSAKCSALTTSSLDWSVLLY